MRNAVALGCIFLLAVAGMLWLDQTPKQLGMSELKSLGLFTLPEPREITDSLLLDEAGNPFDVKRFDGRWSFIFFGYTRCPDICPVTMSILGQAERLMEAEQGTEQANASFQGMFVSVDPERDDQDTMKAYVEAFSPTFIGLIGTGASVRSFGLQLGAGFRRGEKVDTELGYLVEHSPYIFVVDPTARYYGYIKPPFDANRLALIYSSLRQQGGS